MERVVSGILFCLPFHGEKGIMKSTMFFLLLGKNGIRRLGMNMSLKKNSKWIAVLVAVVLIAFFLYGVRKADCKPHDYTDTAMATVVRFRLYGSQTESEKECMMEKLEDMETNILSWRIENSQVAKLNAGAGSRVRVDSLLYGWLSQIREIEEGSDGALDITIAPLARLWNIEGEEPYIPEEDEIQDALSHVNYNRVKLEEHNYVYLEPGTQMDLGAVGKGIACDVVADMMKEENYGPGTVSIGGSIAVVGSKPDGSKWQMGIQDPEGETGEVMGVVEVASDCFLSTSGDYEKYFEQDGVRYHHILDAKTGKPAQSGLHSVTILCDSGLVSDALSTACFVLGLEKGMALAEKWDVEAVFVDEEHQVYITKGLRDSFTLQKDSYTLVSE